MQADDTKVLDGNGLRDARIGVVRNRLFGPMPAADRLAETALAEMKKRGALIGKPFRAVQLAALCQTARPTKNGPRRSRYSDVCCVFRIV
jgi:hypothetical protein